MLHKTENNLNDRIMKKHKIKNLIYVETTYLDEKEWERDAVE